MDIALLVKLPNRPGSLAAAAGAIGRANVNIRAVAGVGAGAVVRFLTDNPMAAEAALASEGFAVERKLVVALPISNTPGELALVTDRLAKARVNLEAAYLAVSPAGEGIELVVEVANPEAAARAARGLEVAHAV